MTSTVGGLVRVWRMIYSWYSPDPSRHNDILFGLVHYYPVSPLYSNDVLLGQGLLLPLTILCGHSVFQGTPPPRALHFNYRGCVFNGLLTFPIPDPGVYGVHFSDKGNPTVFATRKPILDGVWSTRDRLYRHKSRVDFSGYKRQARLPPIPGPASLAVVWVVLTISHSMGVLDIIQRDMNDKSVDRSRPVKPGS